MDTIKNNLTIDTASARRDSAAALSFQNDRNDQQALNTADFDLSADAWTSTEPRDGKAPSSSFTCAHENDRHVVPPLGGLAPKLRKHQLEEGSRRRVFILRARAMRAQNLTWHEIARALNKPVATLLRWLDQVAGVESPTSAECAPQNHKAGRPRKYRSFTDAEASAVKATALPINRNYKDTSIPEAIRRSLAAGLLPSDIADAIRARDAAGLPLLTDAQRDQVALSETEVRAYRSPREAWLDYVQAPGSLMLTRDEITGEERFYQPGEAYTIDDGSINLGCCVPMERPGDKCWDKFGVIVGRFQFIPVADHRTRAILGFSYTARPRDSYRAEDLTATMQTVFAEHGLPREMHLEHGVSDSDLVNKTLATLGVVAKHVHSPHQKVIEKLFDLLWTKLSAVPGQVGRFMGEMEEENKILMACKQGHKDPTRHFPKLPEVLTAMRQAIAELNGQRVISQQYGSWVPMEWFAREAHRTVRKLAPQDAWMFSPVITKPLIVRKLCVATSVSLMPGFSIQFHFDADFLADHVGDRVILHFNPFAPECEAMVILARTGQVLGPARQINRNARFTRRAFGYGADPDIANAAKKQAQALQRAVMAIRADGKTGAAQAEQRDGLGNLVRADVNNARRAMGSTDPVAPSAQDARAASAEQMQSARVARARRAAITSQLLEDF